MRTRTTTDVITKHPLADGRSAWIQRVKLPGVRTIQWSVVVTAVCPLDGPTIIKLPNRRRAWSLLADILKRDVLEQMVHECA